MENPVTRVSLRLPKPLPRHLRDDQVTRLFAVITDLRDRAMFMNGQQEICLTTAPFSSQNRLFCFEMLHGT